MPTPSESKRAVWEVAPVPRDPYALRLTNTDEFDVKEAKRAFSEVKTIRGTNPVRLEQQTRDAFDRWLRDPTPPLSSFAYAKLCDWFLTAKNDRESELAEACRKLWDTLFSVRPDKRLTDPKTHEIVGLQSLVEAARNGPAARVEVSNRAGEAHGSGSNYA